MGITKRDRLALPRGAAWLAMLPVVALVVNHGLLELSWREPVSDFGAELSNPRFEAMRRTRVLASLLPFLLTAVLLTFLFARDYFLLFGNRIRQQLALPMLIVVLAAVWSGWNGIKGEPGGEAIVGTGVFDQAFKGLFAGEIPLRRVVDIVIAIFVVGLSFGASAAVLGTVSSLAAPLPTLPARERRLLIKRQDARLAYYLYASAFLLVTGLFFMDACMRWPAPFSEDRATYMEHVNALMLASGILYSTMIASYYVPVLLWRRSLAASAEWQTHNSAKAKAEADDETSPANVLKAIIALLAPAIAGVLTQVIEGVGL